MATPNEIRPSNSTLQNLWTEANGREHRAKQRRRRKDLEAQALHSRFEFNLRHQLPHRAATGFKVREKGRRMQQVRCWLGMDEAKYRERIYGDIVGKEARGRHMHVERITDLHRQFWVGVGLAVSRFLNLSTPSSSPQTMSQHSRLSQVTSHISPTMSATSFSADVVPQAPEDPLFGLMAAYRRDTAPNKVDLGIGAYRDNNAKPWVLPVVKKADEILRNDPNLNHEYLPIAGLADFTSASQKLILGGESPAIKEKRVTSLQTVSGTGAVHLGALFLQKFYKPQSERVAYFSDPTWPNHFQIFSNVGLSYKTYPYFSKQTRGLDFDGMISTIQSAPEGSIIVLHACAHNPTGVDPTQEQWKKIAEVIRAKKHFPFFDTAYQGFASGDLNRDGWAIRYFVEQGFELVIAQSYAKNFGLYGERAGCFHFVTSPSSDAHATTTRVASQLAILQRSEISNPPAYGARIASLVLNDPKLFAQWEEDLRTMSGRIIEMRKALRSKLEELGTPGTWNHITDQIGMFSFTGLTEKQVLKIREDSHVYMTKNGRISMAGLNTNNVEYFAKAVDKVVRETS